MEAQHDDSGEGAFDSILSIVASDGSVVVVDTKKLLKSPTSKLLAKCFHRVHNREIENIKNVLGIDPFTDAGRIAVVHHFLLVEGQLHDLKSGEFYATATHQDYGSHGLMMTPMGVHASDGPKGGLWNDELFVVSDNLDDIREAIDITEGRERPFTSVITSKWTTALANFWSTQESVILARNSASNSNFLTIL